MNEIVQLEENTLLSIHDSTMVRMAVGPSHIRKCTGSRLWLAFTYATSKPFFFQNNYTVIGIMFTLYLTVVKKLKP